VFAVLDRQFISGYFIRAGSALNGGAKKRILALETWPGRAMSWGCVPESQALSKI